MFCSECGTKNKKDSLFCENCGHKLEESILEKKVSKETNKKIILKHILL